MKVLKFNMQTLSPDMTSSSGVLLGTLGSQKELLNWTTGNG